MHSLYKFCKDCITSMALAHVNTQYNKVRLDDISGVKKWEKVNEGLMKMYKVEVLGKLPIMQHFLFGSIISFEGSASILMGHEDVDHEHVHAFGQEHPGCCSIRVPSSIAAGISESKLHKRMPFD